MVSQLLLLGIAGGFAAALMMAIVVSSVAPQGSAQMMNHQGMMAQPASTPQNGGPHSMFSASGMSLVNNVEITGVSITGNDSLEVDLRYRGSGSSPAVTVVAITNQMSLQGGMGGMSSGMGMMHDGNSGMMSMMGSSMSNPTSFTDNKQWEQWHAQMARWHSSLNSTQWTEIQAMHDAMMSQGMAGPPDWWNGTQTMPPLTHNASQSQTGSSVLESGWTSSSSLTVRLEGSGSGYTSRDLHVMVFPLTS